MMGRPWKCSEEQRLIEMLKKGKTQQQMADALGRTVYSIQSHIQAMRLRDDGYETATYHRWTTSEIRELKKLKQRGFTSKEIAQRIGCRVGGVYGKINDLRRQGKMPRAK